MATTAKAFSPIVQAMLAGTPAQKPRTSFVEAVVDKTVDTLTATTQAVGQLAVAVDTVHFHDGAKKQKLRSIAQRQKFWEDIARKYGLTMEEAAAIMSS